MIFTLIGMPSCGKSCMGRVVSKMLGLRHLDTDKIIEKQYGRRLHELVDSLGREEFMKIEEATLMSFCEDNVLLSTGGSAVYYPNAMEHLKSMGKIIYLYCPYGVIKRRLGDYSKRGVILREGQTLRDLYDERTKLYERYADITVDVGGSNYPLSHQRIVDAIKLISDTQSN